jgi:hypothetical protein
MAFKLDTEWPHCCRETACCFTSGCRDIPPLEDEENFCAGRFCCERFQCHTKECPPKLAIKIFCLDFNASQEGFAIDQEFPHCCAERCCCYDVQLCQPCMFIGFGQEPETDWATFAKGGCICFEIGSFAPEAICQYGCLACAGDQATLDKHVPGGGSGAPAAQAEMGAESSV